MIVMKDWTKKEHKDFRSLLVSLDVSFIVGIIIIWLIRNPPPDHIIRMIAISLIGLVVVATFMMAGFLTWLSWLMTRELKEGS